MRSREGDQVFDSPPWQTGHKGQISQEIPVPVQSQKSNSESLLSSGRKPQVQLCMAQTGTRSTHMVVSAAFMSLG